MTAPMYVETQAAWGQEEPLRQPHRAAFWLFVVALVFGVFQLAAVFLPVIGVAPDASALALIIWAAYAVPFVLFIRWLDLLEPEPVPFIGAAFVWGAVVATSLAYVANTAAGSVIAKAGGAQFAHDWSAALSAPINEETFKALGLVVVILIARRQVNTVLDGIVYGAFVGLGFQVVEDLLYTVRAAASAAGSGGDPIEQVWHYFVIRGLESGIYSHATFTAIAGAGIAYFVVRTDVTLQHRLFVAVALFAAAWSLHFLWDSPWLDDIGSGGVYGQIFVIGLVKGLPGVVLLVLLYRFARRREVAWFDVALQGEEATVSPAEVAALNSWKTRKAAFKAEGFRTGRRGARLYRQLQQAHVRLAVAVVRAGNHTDPRVVQARADVGAARAALASVPPVAAVPLAAPSESAPPPPSSG